MSHLPGPEVRRDVGNSGSFQKKRSNNVWGFVLQEQDLTQTLVKSGHVETNAAVDFAERDVESYDFTKKYDDPRPEITEELEACGSTETGEQDIFSGKQPVTVSGRSIIDYEDTVDKSSRQSRGHKRKAEDDGGRKSGGVHDRLGAKKVTTTRLGDIPITADMDQTQAVHKMAEFLHEAKVELIERVVCELGLPVALRILHATKDVEEAGGMYTMDGSRRRTPGGVYIQLLKQQPEFTSAVKKVVFKEDIEDRNKERNERRKKHRQQNKKKSKGGNAGKQDSGESRSRSNSGQRSQPKGSNCNNDEVKEEGEIIDEEMECENQDSESDRQGRDRQGRHGGCSRGKKYSGHQRRSRSGGNRHSCRKPRYNDLDSMADGSTYCYSDDNSENDEGRGSGRRKSWSNSKAAPAVFDFEAELAAAREQIASKKAEQGSVRAIDDKLQGNEEMTAEGGIGNTSRDMFREDNDMEAAEANVVEVPLDMD